MNDLVKPEDVLKAAIGKHLQESQIAGGIAGDLLLFKKGDWERGADKIPVPEGTRFRPNPWEFWHGWQKFEGGRIAGLQLCRVTEGKPPPRNTLGDLDESVWEDDHDPWQMNHRIIMQDMQGNLVTFSTTSYGGKQACEDLLKAFFTDRDHENLWPVVAIGTAYFNNRDYGRIPKPAFTVVSWAAPWAQPSGDLPGPDTKTIEAPKAYKTFEAPTSFEDELDEEVLF